MSRLAPPLGEKFEALRASLTRPVRSALRSQQGVGPHCAHLESRFPEPGSPSDVPGSHSGDGTFSAYTRLVLPGIGYHGSRLPGEVKVIASFAKSNLLASGAGWGIMCHSWTKCSLCSSRFSETHSRLGPEGPRRVLGGLRPSQQAPSSLKTWQTNKIIVTS